MAKLPPKAEEGNSQEWLNTYADMVTLLLTFFVLLFACSNLDQTKLQFVFQEFQSRGKYVNNIVAQRDPDAQHAGGSTDIPNEGGGDGTMPQSYEELYAYLAEYVESNDLADSVSIEQGDTHIKIRFNSTVMFDGDSAYLNASGKEVLDGFVPAFRALNKFIARNTVSGHTSVGTSQMNDWSLSANRAVSVTNYLISQKTFDESKFRVMGCGPYEPEDADNPAANRRVEMLLLKNDLDYTDMNVLQDIFEHDYNLGTTIFDPENQKPVDIDKLPPGSVDKIVAFIGEKFENNGASTVGQYGPGAVDGSMFIPKDETSGSGASGAGGNNDADDTSS